MLYFIDEDYTQESWAELVLKAVGYNKNPSRVQNLIKSLYREATSSISIEGVEKVVAMPLYEVLDGKNSIDYVARVEPSSRGGKKLAFSIIDLVLRNYK